MVVGCEDVKERGPMFPRLNIKNAEDKVGPKAPPRNKMVLYEQSKSNTPFQTISSELTPKFPPFLRKDLQVSSLSGLVDSKQGIQSSNSGVSRCKAEKPHAYQFRTVNFTKLMPEGHIGNSNSDKNYDHDDALVTPVSAQSKKSTINISQIEEDEETKLVLCESSCSLTSQNSFRNKLDSTRPIKLTSAKYVKNQIDNNVEANHIDLTEEGTAHPLAGYGYMTDESSISSVRIRAPKPMKKDHPSFIEDLRSISADGLKRLHGRNGHTNEENTTFGDIINFKGGYLEKPATRGVDKCPDVLEIGRNFFWGKRDGMKSEDTYTHYDAPTLSKNIPDNAVGMKVTPADVIRAIGEKQFWITRRTIINQDKIFAQQVAELHRLMKVQKLMTESPRLSIQNQLQLGQPSLKAPAPNKLQSAYVTEQPPSNAKPNTKFEKPTPDQCAGLSLFPLPGVNNMSKGPSVQLPNYGTQSENNQLALPTPTNNTKPSSCYIYPPPGNQWLMPFMSHEGLIYKPIGGPCPPNAGFMGPAYGSCNPISLSLGNKDVQEATHVPYIFPPYVPPVMHSTPLPVFAHEQMNRFPTKMLSKGTIENQQSTGAVSSSILYRSSSIMSSQISPVMTIHNTYDNHTAEDRDVQIGICSSPRKRMKGDTLPLFPTAPTFGTSSDQQKAQAVEDNQPCIVKAIPHNPKSTTESASRLFMSIQEERKHLC